MSTLNDIYSLAGIEGVGLPSLTRLDLPARQLPWVSGAHAPSRPLAAAHSKHSMPITPWWLCMHIYWYPCVAARLLATPEVHHHPAHLRLLPSNSLATRLTAPNSARHRRSSLCARV